MRREPLETAFWRKVHRGADCWEWTASLFPNGYGQFRPTRELRYAHRVSWVLANGPIPEGLQVLHRCDNRRCVRPDHLFLGTAADNLADMRAKGRARDPRGENHGSAKLTTQAAVAIRVAYASGNTLAHLGRVYGVRFQTIQAIVRGRTWQPSEANVNSN